MFRAIAACLLVAACSSSPPREDSLPANSAAPEASAPVDAAPPAPDPASAECRSAFADYQAKFGAAQRDQIAQIPDDAREGEDLGALIAERMVETTLTREQLSYMKKNNEVGGGMTAEWVAAFAAAERATDACGEDVAPPPA